MQIGQSFYDGGDRFYEIGPQEKDWRYEEIFIVCQQRFSACYLRRSRSAGDPRP